MVRHLVLSKTVRFLIGQIFCVSTPNYLRDIQPNHIACLLLSLIEQIEYGDVYQHTTINLANLLGQKLQNYGFNVVYLFSYDIPATKYTSCHTFSIFAL